VAGSLVGGGSFLLLPTFCMGVTLPLLARTVSYRLLEVPGWAPPGTGANR